jgi:hypothetical protein
MSKDKPLCDLCARTARYHFAAADPAGDPLGATRCARHAIFYQPVRRSAQRIAAVVGTVLFGINQADVVFTGRLTPLVVVKSVLTYAVPFSVSTYSALRINRLRDRDHAG